MTLQTGHYRIEYYRRGEGKVEQNKTGQDKKG